MPFRWNPREHVALGQYFLKWMAIAVPVGAVIGTAVAIFLWSLDLATTTRWDHPHLLYFLPLAGVAIGLLYHLLGKSVEGGNNLIMEQIHEPGGGVPSRMAPLVLIGTVITHLFGGSAGREGTAVQMGGSIASTVCRRFGLSIEDSRILLMAGIAGGFGAVFGTPLTGAVFAIEVLAIGRMSYEALVPCLIASVAGDWVCSAWNLRWGHFHFHIQHTRYAITSFSKIHFESYGPPLSVALLWRVAVASAAFGLASVLFAELTHGLQRVFKWAAPWPVLRPALGGVVVIALVCLVGSDYIGLGVRSDPHHPNQVSIISSFSLGGASAWSWWWKILFTAVTLSCGFKGGEVTPLFFVGAALGNTMARLLGVPEHVDLFAGLGFVGVFSGATNTPLACTIMGIELFAAGQSGLLVPGFVVYMAVACIGSYLISGHSGIYLSQRIATPKLFSPGLPPGASLRTARELQPRVSSAIVAGIFNTLAGKNHDEAASERSVAPIDATRPVEDGGIEMSHRHKVVSQEIGQVRIYMTPRESRKQKGLMKKVFARPLYQEIIDAAKADGILNAVAHHTHYGYSGNGKIQADHHELPNKLLNLCVELISRRDQLEQFCRKHGDLLKGKVIVYKHMEHWEIGPQETLQAHDVPQAELDADVEDDVTDEQR